MGRIKELKNSLLLTAIYFVILFVFWYFKIPCFFRSLFGIDCPGCGMTRAVISALKFDFASAFSYHPMFWSMPVLYLYFIFNGKVFNIKKLDYSIMILIAIGFLLNFIIKML